MAGAESGDRRLMQRPPILVISCDRYADVWKPFLAVFRMQWPDCPYEIMIGTNHLQAPAGTTTVATGDDLSWALGVRRMLDAVSDTHVIIMLEDFFLTQPVDTQKVDDIVRIARSEPVDTIRLSPLPAPSPLPDQTVPGYPNLGIVEPGTLYRVSTQPAIWRVSTLLEYLIPGANPWEFEQLGTRLSERRNHLFWGPFTPTLNYFHAVEKGRWKPQGLALCKRLGIQLDLGMRPSFTDEQLSAFFAADPVSHELAGRQRAAIQAFARKDRSAGARQILAALRRRPFDPRFWAVLVAGVVSHRALRWLGDRHISRTVARIHRRHQQSLAARALHGEPRGP